ncbi:hypothetical protein ACH5RR_032334 [Cinchona calisaya]|uniref:Uncharacterized protein n=1 Tax=Cinchona calisaya TaxID=153742 RepID=A0ABD2YHT2_9GENT
MDMKRRQHESFRKYAHHWRNMAVKVEPPMTDREMVKAFICTLEELFHEKLSSLVNYHFSEVVEQGEILEQRSKSGKFTDISVTKVLSKGETKGKEKKDRGSTVIERERFEGGKSSRSRRFHSLPPMQLTSQDQNIHSKRPKNSVFTPLPKSLSQIFIDLHAVGKLEPLPPSVKMTSSKRHNADQTCAFHSNISGHATDNFHALHHEIQDLIDKNSYP